MRTAYSPGTPTTLYRTGNGTFAAPSWRGEKAAYLVNVAANTCTCKDFEHRQAKVGGRCKHLKQAHAGWFAGLVAKAQALTDAELLHLLPKYEKTDLAVAVAIRGEIHSRGQQTASA